MAITTPNFWSVQHAYFQPAMTNILSITNGLPTTITTTFDGINPGNNLYITGLVARLNIPVGFGMQQINQKEAPITVISPSQFTMHIDSTSFDPFVVPAFQPGNFGTPATVTIVGEVNSMLKGAVQNILLPIV